MWRDPITDRTQTDILFRTAKAFLNVSDWLRITGNTEQVQVVVRLMLSLEVPLSALIEPTIITFPRVEDINTLIANIDALQAAACLPAGIGIVPLKYNHIAGSGAVAPDYADVNDWERDLLLIRAWLVTAADYRMTCGVANCGQPRFWQARFRVWPYILPAVSPVRSPRCGLTIAGASLIRQNSWRKY